jgi:hypothetical protein
MDIYTKKICCDFAILCDYIYGGYINDINNLIGIVGDINSREEAIEKIHEFKNTVPALKPLFEKLEASCELRYIIFSNLHDSLIKKITIDNNTMCMNLELSGIINYKGQLLDKIILVFDITENIKIPHNMSNRTIMNFHIDISNNNSFILTLDTYNCTLFSKNIYECIKFSFNFSNIHFKIDNLTEQERTIVNFIKEHGSIRRIVVEDILDVGNTRAKQIITSLIEKDIVISEGKGPSVKYKLK